jgi:hypothetical protein
MAKIFYDHLIIFEELISFFDKHELSKQERTDILTQVDKLLHNRIIDTILTHLPAEHHEVFITKFTQSPDSKKLMEFLREHIQVDIEKEIFIVAESVKKDVYKLVQQSKKAGQ